MAIFYDIIECTLKVFRDDFSVFCESFKRCLDNMEFVLTRGEENNLVMNWEKCHFMVKDGIIIGNIILKEGFKVDQANI